MFLDNVVIYFAERNKLSFWQPFIIDLLFSIFSLFLYLLELL